MKFHSRWAVTVFAASFAMFHASTSQAALVFTDWTSVNTTTNVAVGTLGPVSVTLTGTDINYGVTDGSSTVFNQPYFSPPLTSSDEVGIGGSPSVFSYTVTFGAPVANPRMHILSLASALTFSGIPLTKLSGESDFVVSGSTVTGVDNNTPNGHDANGTIELSGIFSSYTFTAQYAASSGDGISIQIGADLTPVPVPAAVWLFSSGLLGLIGLARRKAA